MSNSRYDLTQGGIIGKLMHISLPVIGVQVIQMTYNLTDMFWLGRLSAGAVAASGAAGMYLWMTMAFMIIGSRGAEIGVSQNIGKGDRETARQIGQSAYTLSVVAGVVTGLLMILFRVPLIGFFAFDDAQVIADAQSYLAIVGLNLPFSFLSATSSSIFNGSGNSRTPFMVNCISLGTNVILDPILIFGLKMGVVGAAFATVIAQAIACSLMMVMLLRNKHRPFEKFRLFAKPIRAHIERIIRWTAPMALESFLFTFLTMANVRIIAAWGTNAVAAQRIGSQIESLTWLIGGGYSVALTSFIGQNYGAGKWGRIHTGFKLSTVIMLLWGAAVTCVLFFGAEPLMRIFLPEAPEAVAIGANYVRILAACQLLACLEGIAAGAFRGMGRTSIPSAVSITCNALRVVAAYFLSRTALGLNGVFWAISIGSAVRGLWMYLWYKAASRKFPVDDVTHTDANVSMEDRA